MILYLVVIMMAVTAAAAAFYVFYNYVCGTTVSAYTVNTIDDENIYIV